jgi:hypothetical protein
MQVQKYFDRFSSFIIFDQNTCKLDKRSNAIKIIYLYTKNIAIFAQFFSNQQYDIQGIQGAGLSGNRQRNSIFLEIKIDFQSVY